MPRSDADNAALRANTIPWPPILLVAGGVAAWELGRAMPLDWPGLDDGPAHAIGLGFGIVGALLIALAVGALLSHGTTVMPDRAASVLVTSGPYAFFRNPIYLGEVLVLFGVAEMTKNIWFVAAALAFALLVTPLQIVPEERHLAAMFGEAYASYKARTRRWI